MPRSLTHQSSSTARWRRTGVIGAVVASLMAAGLGIFEPTPVLATSDPETYVVRGTSAHAARAAVADVGASASDGLDALGMTSADLTAAQVAALADDPRVVDVTLNGRVELHGHDAGAASADATPGFSSLAEVNHAIGADALHARGLDGTGVDVALIDSGVVPVPGLNHPDRVVNGPDLSFESIVDDIRYLDTYGHGTHLGGIIAGEGDDVDGVAPDSRLVSLKVAAHDGATDVSQVLAAINWVIEHKQDAGLNIRVLNLAFGTDGTQTYLLDPLTYAAEVAWHHGLVVVVSAGNEGPSSALRNPAYDPFVLAVGAADTKGTADRDDDELADFSSWGSTDRSVDLVAPGVSVASARNPGSFVDENHPSARVGDHLFRGSGTSQATAVVAGAAAALLEAEPRLTPDSVKALLMSSSRKLHGSDDLGQGAGMIDLEHALRRLPVVSKNHKRFVQDHARAAGTGSIDLARGTATVVDGDVELVGEIDIFGRTWTGEEWAGRTWTGRTWTGGEWMGRTWTGDGWNGRSWTGRTWTGRTWTDDSWAGRTWTGRTWTGRTWTGRKWAGDSWNGRKWADHDWSGTAWGGRKWAGRTWTAVWE